MTPDAYKSSEITKKLRAVKANCDKAPSGARKAFALKHYYAAEKAHTAKNDAHTHQSLDAATKILM